jgi:hypothetical protein
MRYHVTQVWHWMSGFALYTVANAVISAVAWWDSGL